MATPASTDGNDMITDDPAMSENIEALGGNDSITVSGGSDTVDGGLGEDTLIVNYIDSTEAISSIGGGFGALPTIGSTSPNGTPSVAYSNIEHLDIRTGSGNDALVGGFGADTISSGAGNDQIDSVDRPESIFGASIAPVSDVVNAGDGDDNVNGGRLDILDGGAGNDFLQINFGFNGDDANPPAVNLVLDANGSGIANDGTSITGFEAINLTLTNLNDTVDTGDVVASLNGQDGDDLLTTGAGDDQIFGGAGNDTINAGNGNNQLSGGAGNDVILSGAGNDSITVDPANDGIDSVNLGAGSDQVTFVGQSPSQIRVTFTSADVGNGNALDGGNGSNEDAGLAVRVQSEDADGNVVGVASRYDDEGITFLEGTQGYSFDVRDLATGVARGDQFKGVVLGTSDGDTLSFFPPFREGQAFYYNGGGGNDSIIAGSGNDFLVGGAGDDSLTANGGNDTIFGGTGTDSAFFSGNRLDYKVVAIDASNIQVTDLRDGSPDGIDIIQTVENFTFQNGTFDTTTVLTSNASEVPSAGPDRLTGTTASESFFGGAGNDTINGGAGNDTISGGDGSDTLTATPGLGEHAVVFGGSMVTDPNDVGDNISVSGAGSADVYGNGGDDVINYSASGAGNIYGGVGGDQINVQNDANNMLVGGTGSGDIIVVNGNGNNTVLGGSQITDAADGADQITVNGNGNNSIYGNGGDDTILVTGTGNNTIYGGVGNDQITGGSGDDLIIGGPGANSYTGGRGADSFVHDAGAQDTITDFNSAEGDSIVFNDSAISGYTVGPDGSATFSFADGGSITILGTAPMTFGIA